MRERDLPIEGEPTSARLQRLSDEASGDTVDLNWVVGRLGERSFGLIIALLGVLSLLPGVSILAGLLLLFPGVQMMLGRDRASFPAFLGRRRVTVANLRRMVTTATPWLVRLERLVRPRWLTPFALTRRVTGLLVVVLALLLLAVPLPFIGVPFGAALVVLAVGYLERDGIVFASSLAVTATIAAGAVWLVLAQAR